MPSRTNGRQAPSRATRPGLLPASAMTAALSALVMGVTVVGAMAVQGRYTANAAQVTAAGVPVVAAAAAGGVVPGAMAPGAGGPGAAALGAGAAPVPGAVAGAPPAAGAAAGTGAPTTFRGATINTKWGPVQAQVTTVKQNGAVKVTDAAVPVNPGVATGNPTSVSLNNANVLGQLRTQTINSNGMKIDGVSGSTVTSDGYRQSLQSAMDMARAA